MAVENIYATGKGEATVLPDSGTGELAQQKYLIDKGEQEKKQAQRSQAFTNIYSASEEDAWDVDYKNYTNELAKLKEDAAMAIARGEMTPSDIPQWINKVYNPARQKGVFSKKQQQEYDALNRKYLTSPKDLYDERAETNLAIYRDPVKAAATNPEIYEQMEKTGWDAVTWRTLYGEPYKKLPLKYDDIAYVSQRAKGIQSEPFVERKSYVDSYTGKRVVEELEGFRPNQQGILDVVNSMETSAAQGDEFANNFWRYRTDAVSKNVSLKDDDGVMVFDPEKSTEYGKEIFETAKKLFPREIANPETFQQALVKAGAYKDIEKYQKRQERLNQKHIAVNGLNKKYNEKDLFASYGGGWEAAIQRLGGQNAKQTITPIGDRTGGSETFYRRAMDNVVVNTPMSPRVYNATTGQMESSSETLPVILSGRGVEYVYKEGTKINGVDVGGSVVPQYNWIKYKDKIESKKMAQGTVKRKNAEGEDVIETIFIPYDLVQNGFISQVQGGDAKKTEEILYDDALEYAVDEQNKALKRLGKSTTPTTGQSVNQKQTLRDKYKRK